MEIEAGAGGRGEEIVELFSSAFAASEGPAEGALIGALVRRLLGETPAEDLFVFTARDGGALVGACVFSRLAYDEDPRSVFVLGPVAVATARQGQGIGQRLLRHGLAALRHAGIDVAFTYGDPAYYGKVGFAPITEADAQAPFPLQQPHGWLAQSLTGGAVAPLKGPSRCVPALADPVYW